MSSNPLYQQIARRLALLIGQDVYQPGERVPSIRELSDSWNVSLTTVILAYRHLQNAGKIISLPQSGYYVAHVDKAKRIIQPKIVIEQDYSKVHYHDIFNVHKIDRADLNKKHLSDAEPNYSTRSIKDLLSLISKNSRQLSKNKNAALTDYQALRQTIAQRLSKAGLMTSPAHVLLTHGAIDALTFSLRRICQPGDYIAVESPTSPFILHCIDAMKCRPLPIAIDPRHGLQIADVKKALKAQTVRCLISMSTFHFPTCATISPENKESLANLADEHNLPIIELDLYGDLGHNGLRPPHIKSYDQANNVTLCASFNKALLPEIGVGYLIASRHDGIVNQAHINPARSCNYFTATALENFISNGGYDRHIRFAQRLYASNVSDMERLLTESLPTGTIVHTPAGGYHVWVQLPENIDAFCVYRTARMNGIVLSPGNLFNHTPTFSHHLSLNAATLPSDIGDTIKKLGWIATNCKCDH